MSNTRTRVNYSEVSPMINDVNALRVQTLGSTSTINQTDMRELANLNIVEYVEDVPSVDITLDTMEVGTNETIGLLANKSFGCKVLAVATDTTIVSDKIKILAGAYYSNGLLIPLSKQTITLTTAGVKARVSLKPDPSANPLYTITYAALPADPVPATPTGEISIAILDIQDNAGSPEIAQANITDDRSWKDIDIMDFEYAKVDITAPVKFRTDTTIARSKYIENAYVTNLDYSFNVNGQATENYSLTSDNKRWFFNNSSNIIVDRYYESVGGSTVLLSQDPTQLVNGNYMLKVLKNGTELTEGVDFTVTTGATPSIDLTVALVVGDTVLARYTAPAGGTFPNNPLGSNETHPETAGGLSEGNIEIYLSDDTNNKLLRIQSTSITASLNRAELGQLGELAPYSRPLEIPVEVSTSLEILDSDMSLFARLAGKDISTVTEISIEDLLKNLDLTVEIYRENNIKRAKLPTGHPDLLPLKTIKVSQLVPTGESWSVNTGEDTTQSFDFRSFNLQISA